MKNLAKVLALTIVLFSASLGCHKTNLGNSEKHEELNHVISTSTPSAVGMRAEIINEVVDSISSGFFPNRHSLLIYKDQKLVLEKYFPGQDYNWGRDIGIVEHDQTVLHDMRSVSKSAVSACIGIAIDQNIIESVDQKVFEFFDEYQDHKRDGKDKLTVKHLLTMTSGLEWNEDVPYNNPENSEIQMDQSSDRIEYVLSRKLTSIPGTEWNYNGGTTELLAAIIKRTTGKNIHDFAKEYLFEPMGITKSEWTNSTGTTDPAAASGLRLTSRDMLKFGLLYYNNGRLGTKQIIPQEWVESSIKSHITFGRDNNVGYGYQFWIFNFKVQGKSFEVPTAVGNGDQRIFIDKRNELVVATTSGNYNLWNIKNDAEAILEKIYESFPLN